MKKIISFNISGISFTSSINLLSHRGAILLKDKIFIRSSNGKLVRTSGGKLTIK